MSKIPLGQATPFPQEYAPDLLFAIARDESRQEIGLRGALPFRGRDIWNAWELTWLGVGGKPVIATATITFDAASPMIVESKSLKLYLNSLAMSRYEAPAAVSETIARDLTRVSGAPVSVAVHSGAGGPLASVRELPGTCIDDVDLCRLPEAVDAGLLRIDSSTAVAEALYSHLLRSNCPVTGQPDFASILVRYEGAPIDRQSLLQYIVSFRRHEDFHEACVERMFVDITDRCMPASLTVYARYTRRGGLDINPFRSSVDSEAENFRLWRQ